MNYSHKTLNNEIDLLDQCFGNEAEDYLKGRDPPFNTSSIPRSIADINMNKNHNVTVYTKSILDMTRMEVEPLLPKMVRALELADSDTEEISIVLGDNCTLAIFLKKGDTWWVPSQEAYNRIIMMAELPKKRSIYSDSTLSSLVNTFNTTSYSAILVWVKREEALIPKWLGLDSVAHFLITTYMSPGRVVEASKLGPVVVWYWVYKLLKLGRINTVNTKTQAELENLIVKEIASFRT